MFKEFLRPKTVAEAVLLRAKRRSSVYLAGGTEVNALGWGGDADVAISLSALPLGGLKRSKAGLSVGAGTTLQALIDSKATPPLLAASARHFANRSIRNVATIGGNVGSNKSCSNLIPALLALDASVVLAGARGKKTVPLSVFVAKRDPKALLLSFEIPAVASKRRWAARKYSRTVNDVSILSVAVTFDGDAAKVLKPRVAVGGVAKSVVRLAALEKRLDGKPLPPRDGIEALARPLIKPIDDLRGSAAFKRHAAAAMVAWALHEAASPSGSGR